jgi:Uma2 family endonuclease
MSASGILGPAGEYRAPVPARLPPVDFAREKALADSESLVLLEEDGIPMDTPWHRYCMNLLIEQVEYHCRGRSDFYVGGNMFVYFSVTQARNLDYRGPDFFYVSNTSRQPIRRFWVVWEEGRTPDVVIELASASTREEDYGTKFAIYRDRLRVGNYFIYDPETRVLDGWRLQGADYVPIPRQPDGRLRSDQLQLSLGEWVGSYMGYDMTWLRWYGSHGAIVPTFAEAARAEANDWERRRIEAERHRIEAERRAEPAEAEVARLNEQLAKLQPTPKEPS